MHRKPRALFRRALFVGSAILSALFSVSCSKSSGGDGNGTVSGFQLLSISVFPNDTWNINRAIEFEFSEAIDFLSISSNTISISTLKGLPAIGAFSFKRIDTDGDGILDTVDETIVLFQPTCPLLADFSDAGLKPSSTYVISVVGRSSGTDNTLKSKAGNKSLDITQRREFFTPDSLDRSVVFVDGGFGPPEPVVRTMGTSVSEGVTYLEIGSNTSPDSRIFFEFDPVSQTYNTASGMAAPSTSPLNLYAEPTSRVAMVVEFNQPVDPSAINISPTRVSLEFMDSGGMWLPLDTSVQLVENCTTAGARLRLEAVGVLPAGSFLRAVIKPGFLDITGADATQATRTAFAVVPTAPIAYASLPANPTDGADEYIEEFDFETGPLAFQDTSALFSTAMASSKDGRLEAAFDFEGTGGPSGDFDWLIETGEIFLFDTDGTSIVGGPNGAKNAVQNTTGGVVDIRNLTIEAGGELRVQGSNTLSINASGTVQIDGQITLNGRDATDVVIVNSAHIAAPGGAGAAGGGAGGSGSGALNTSTARGSRGRGPLGSGPVGGFGGESGYATILMGKDARRPGGGGGGRFAADVDPMVDGLYAGAGLDGSAMSHSAVTLTIPALGGPAGDGPFLDLDPANDFFGTKPEVVENGPGDFSVTDLIRGELTGLSAGYGGGGGGDAMPSNGFPTPDWTSESDERGGGGGGGGGGLRLRALGPVIFGPAGEIHADGGAGATGENTLEQDHVAGTGGSGSGGHVMIESATNVDFTNGDPAMAPFPSASHITAIGGPMRTGPLTNPVIVEEDISHGGSGGPGVIQIHVPRVNTYSDDPMLSDIVLPTLVIGGATANKLEDIATPTATHLVATFGAQSAARSRWISIGGADQDPINGVERLSYLFGGIETAGMDAGKILTTAGIVDSLPPVLGPELLSAGSVAIIGDGVTLQVAGVSLLPIIDTPSDIYLRTPALLKNFVLRIEESATPATFKDFVVADASYNDAGQRLSLMSGAALDASVDTISSYSATLGAPAYRLLPRFFQVSTDGVINSLPDSSFVKISFEGTKDDGFGAPDEANILVPRTSDIDDFNSMALPLGELKYFRIQVEFDLDAMGAGLTPDTKPVALDFLRLPFRF